MSGESKILNTENGLMNYQHARCKKNVEEWKKNVSGDRFCELLT